MGQRNDGREIVVGVLFDRVIGHLVDQLYAFNLPLLNLFGPGIAHHHMVVQQLRHLCQVLGHLAGADQEQLVTGSVGLCQESFAGDFCVLECADEFQVLEAVPVFNRDVAGCDIDAALDALALFKPGSDLLKLWQIALVHLGFDHDLQLAATGQAELFSLVRGDAIDHDFRLRRGEFAFLDFLQQVFLDAATGQ